VIASDIISETAPMAPPPAPALIQEVARITAAPPAAPADQTPPAAPARPAEEVAPPPPAGPAQTFPMADPAPGTEPK